MSFASPIMLAASLILWIGVCLALLRRKTILPGLTKSLIILGAALLALAAGGATIEWPQAREVRVLVDHSASTRTATFRDPEALEKRVQSLLGTTRHVIADFSDDSAPLTEFKPPHADAILLLSDAQFDISGIEKTKSPPIYVVVDPNLEHPDDAAVTQLEWQGNSIAAHVSNSGEQRRLEFSGAETSAVDVSTGKHILTSAVDPKASSISARFIGQDAWPENDALTIQRPPPQKLERWWIGASPPSGDWRTMSPQDLPTDPLAYLWVSVIALNNIPADAIAQVQQDRIAQYVNDLGGGLVIIGGDHAFAAGGYIGSTIEACSPLSSSPSTPQHHWIILVDSSGSMAAPADGGSRWERASEAAAQLVRVLPPTDVVSIGDFARSLRWWSQSRPASATAKLTLPPKEIYPQGPTNLQAVLQGIAANFESPVAAEIILVSDADAAIDNPEALADLLKSKNIQLHLLATADISKSVVPKVVELTGGHVSTQLDSKLWSDAIRKLQRGAIGDGLQHVGTNMTFTADLQALPGRTTDLWNLTWLKRDATELASTQPNDPGRAVLAAHWHVGSGHVAAAAFEATSSEAEALANLVARAPRDPRFKISMNQDSHVSVRVEAIDGDRYLNDLAISLALNDETDLTQARREMAFAQVAPGRYEASIPSPRSPTIASIRVGDQLIDRLFIPARYAPEFDHIGNNHPIMQALAQITGGAVIELTQATPIDFHWPRQPVSLSSMLATLGALLIATGLLIFKFRS